MLRQRARALNASARAQRARADVRRLELRNARVFKTFFVGVMTVAGIVRSFCSRRVICPDVPFRLSGSPRFRFRLPQCDEYARPLGDCSEKYLVSVQ